MSDIDLDKFISEFVKQCVITSPGDVVLSSIMTATVYHYARSLGINLDTSGIKLRKILLTKIPNDEIRYVNVRINWVQLPLVF